MKTLSLAILLSLVIAPVSLAKNAEVIKNPAPTTQGTKRLPASSEDESADGKVHIMQMDDDFPIDELEGDGVTVDRIAKRSKGGLPPLRVQHQHLREAGLAEVITWDPVEHDLFYGIVGESQWDYVMRKYGKLYPERKLHKLRKIIKLYREEEEY